MKKILLLLTPLFFIFFSCKKEITKVQKVDQAYSAIYTIQSTDWTSTNNGLIYTAQLNVPELDNRMYQNGAVLVYLSFTGTSYFEALPEVFDGITYGTIHSPGYVGIDISAVYGDPVNPPAQSITAKVVLIDATALSMHKDVNLNDLGAVQKAFNVH